ncbi:MAG TPA: hypothetical protein VM915_03390 [Verrucomicrobiae bacterium]|jgi:hypothetical protein|nr:hypothetical protein [Verrucomicrobiae bacterium]
MSFFDITGLHRIRRSGARDDGDGDVYLGRLLKLVPGEALLIYPIGKAASPPEMASYWPIIVAFIVVALRVFTTREKGRSSQIVAVLISLVTYVIWVLANGDAFGPLSLTIANGNVWLIWAALGWIAISPIYKGS